MQSKAITVIVLFWVAISFAYGQSYKVYYIDKSSKKLVSVNREIEGIPHKNTSKKLLRHLIAGPTQKEKEQGLTTALIPGINIDKITESDEEIKIFISVNPLTTLFNKTYLENKQNRATIWAQIKKTIQSTGTGSKIRVFGKIN